MNKANKSSDPKSNKDFKQLNLKEYKILKEKKAHKIEDEKMPLLVKLFLTFPLIVLCFIVCFGMFCMPQISHSWEQSQKKAGSK